MQSQGRKPREPEWAFRARFGESVRAARETAEISQEDLAHRIGMSRRYLSGVERGQANPTIDQIFRLADGLGIGVGELFPNS